MVNVEHFLPIVLTVVLTIVFYDLKHKLLH